MNISKEEIHDLEEWLGTRLPALVAHGEKVRDLLRAANGSEKIIESSVDLILSDGKPAPELTPQQLAIWKALLPIVSEHGLMAVRGGDPALEKDRALNKQEAAEYLGISMRKLQRHMKKRQIEYEKYGTGQTASVRFRRSELERFRQSRQVTAAKARRP